MEACIQSGTFATDISILVYSIITPELSAEAIALNPSEVLVNMYQQPNYNSPKISFMLFILSRIYLATD